MLIMKEKRNTLQKRIVWDIFCSMTNHPSAKMVCDEVHKQYPSISHATVYRLLGEFAEEGKISRLRLAGSPDHYDFNTSEHYHVVCRECGAVADVRSKVIIDSAVEKPTACEDFLVEDCHLEFVGLCKECQKNLRK